MPTNFKLGRFIMFVAGAIAAAAACHAARADLTLALETDANPSNVLPQQPFHVWVRVSGIEPGSELNFLGVTLTTNAFRLGTPTAITPGEIVPNPTAGPDDFLSLASPGYADASFMASAVGNGLITSDGIFAVFEFLPRHAGDVTVDMIFADAMTSDAAGDSEPVTLSLAQPLSLYIFCPADFNLDGGVDGADVDAFFAAWESGDSLSDVNGDGGIDGADVAVFFDSWESSSC
jgi:hypothetical protein